MALLLWWGRSDPHYSRNRMVVGWLNELGWEVEYFHPVASQLGIIEAYFHRLSRPDLIWVPCFRQRDIFSAACWAQKWKVPLILDPLISAYEKEVFERQKWLPDSRKAERRRRYEVRLFSKADQVIADTPAHARFFRETLQVDTKRLSILYVGAETALFKPQPFPELRLPLEILFYGSFLRLQGVDVILEAARKCRNLKARWVLLGDGEFRVKAEKEARELENVFFEPWIDYAQLPDRIARAHIVLGIFGSTPKAEWVIPNKIFQAMAAGRPIISRRATAYPQALSDSDIIGWVPPGHPDALAELVAKWLEHPTDLENRGQRTRNIFDTFFNDQQLKEHLSEILQKVMD